jgi:hypothetical protein
MSTYCCDAAATTAADNKANVAVVMSAGVCCAWHRICSTTRCCQGTVAVEGTAF